MNNEKIIIEESNIETKMTKLNQDISTLKEILSYKIFEKEHLTNYTCKNIETDYILKFGLFEYKSAEYDLEIKKILRKIELINKKINFTKPETNSEPKNKEIDLIAIENHIKNEFKKEDEELKEQIAKVTITLNHNQKKIKSINFNKINKIYKECISTIHPDLFLKQSQYEETLYYNSKEAYEDEDLKEMEAVKILIQTHKIREKPLESIEELANFKNILNIRLELTEKEIKEILNSSPYNKQQFLLDKEKVKKYQNELKEDIMNKEKEYHSLEDELSRIIKDNDINLKLNQNS